MTRDRVVEKLTRSECDTLLASRQVGRVVLSAAALPTAITVPYGLVGGDVIFRGVGVALDANGTVVAFQVDDFDVSTRSGWSVVVTGIATVVTDGQEIRELDQEGIPSWLEASEPRYVRLPLGLMSGQRVRAGQDAQPA